MRRWSTWAVFPIVRFICLSFLFALVYNQVVTRGDEVNLIKFVSE